MTTIRYARHFVWREGGVPRKIRDYVMGIFAGAPAASWLVGDGHPLGRVAYIYNRGCASQVSFGLNKFGPNQLTNPLTKLDFHVDFDVHLHVGHHVHLVYLYVGHHNVVSVL